MNKIAFIVPIYPPHYKYAISLIKSWKEFSLNNQSDLWFVFSSNKDKELFGDWKNSIILPEHDEILNNPTPINIKKIFALDYISQNFNYIYSIIIDSETEFCKNIDLLNVCEQFFKNKVLYGNYVTSSGRDLTEKIKFNCKKYFYKYENFEKLNTDYYLWLNQLCIYNMQDISEFLNVINYEKNKFKYCWEDFDYYLYMYYLLLCCNFDIIYIGIDSEYGALESSLDKIIIKNNNYEKLNIYACSASLFDILDNPSLFMVFHTDREYHWQLNKIKNTIQNHIRDEFIELVPLNQKKCELYSNQIDDEEIINSSDISVVVQGAINQQITSRSIESIKTFLPNSEIILSTWKNSKTDNLNIDTLILNDDPGAVKTDLVNNIVNNQNRQLVSTLNGVKKASKKYILKLRTDFELHNANFLNYWNRFPQKHSNFNIFSHRIITSSIFSREFSDYSHRPVLFHPSDFFMFGRAEDIKNYYKNIRFATDKELGNWQYLYPNKIPYPEAHYRYAPEQFFFFSYVKNFFPNIKFEDWTDWNEENCKISHNILLNNFIFLDYKQSGIYSEKFHNLMNNTDSIYGIISFQRFEENYKNDFDNLYQKDEIIENSADITSDVIEMQEIFTPQVSIPCGYDNYQKYNYKYKKHLNYFIKPFAKIFTWIYQPIPVIVNLLKLLINPYFIRRLAACLIINKEKRKKFRGEI